jgi:ribose transport system permease protein
LIATVNLIVIMIIGIPPIVGTLATGLIVDSAVLVVAGRLTASAPPALTTLMDTRWRGLPAIAGVAALVAAGAAVVLHRTRFGREMIATGQSRGAAARSGVYVMRRTAYCYMVSGCCAGVAGLLLASLSAAPAIGIGDPYLLLTVAVVVLGGSSIMGGRPTVFGVVVAAMMLNVMQTLLYTLHMSIAAVDIAEGLLIIAALAGAGERSGSRV